MELDVGIYMIAGMQIIVTLMDISNAVWWISYFMNNVWQTGVFCGIHLLFTTPTWLGCFYYLRYFAYKDRKPETSRFLPRAHLLNMVSILLTSIWGIAGGYACFNFPVVTESFMLNTQAAATAATAGAISKAEKDGRLDPA